jgi:hypothetical protein
MGIARGFFPTGHLWHAVRRIAFSKLPHGASFENYHFFIDVVPCRFAGDLLWRHHAVLTRNNHGCPRTPNLDPKTNASMPFILFVRLCDSAVFRPPLFPTARNASFPLLDGESTYGLTDFTHMMEPNGWSQRHQSLDLNTQPNLGGNEYHVHPNNNDAMGCKIWTMGVIPYLSLTAAVYFTARGQGILPERANMLSKMQRSHATVITLWLVATCAAIYVVRFD